MISLKDLAQRIETGLNGIIDSSGGLTVGGVQYRFRITADTANARDAEPYREGNEFFAYIQGNLISTGSNVQTTAQETLTAKISAFLEIVVPVVDEYTASGATELPDSIRGILDAFFAENQMFTQSEDNVDLLFVAQYQIANSGTRAVRPDIGDSFTFSVAISYDVIQQGISSNKIVVRIVLNNTYYRLIYSQLGIRRTTATDPATPSDSSAINKNVAQSSALVLNVSGAIYMNELQPIFANYLINGIQDELEIYVGMPCHGQSLPVDKNYKMILSDLSIGAEGILPASFSAQFVEVLE